MTSVRPMGHQPALDGVRALSVALVVAYHAGAGWMHGGFFGVEVFFVVSGFLITRLLLEEWDSTGTIRLGSFWFRRARRLLPALFVMLAAVAVWVVVAAPTQADGLRTDLLPAVLYVGNWAQILGDVPYFSAADPPLRHLWSLAVEEQWYVVWPLVVAGLLGALGRHRRAIATGCAVVAVSIAVWSAVAAASGDPLIGLAGRSVDRFNFLYLNTLGRSSGLLLGAAAAFVWRPWDDRSGDDRSGDAADRRPALWRSRGLDALGVGAVAAIVAVAATRPDHVLSDAVLYQVWMPVVTLASMVAVMAAVHPAATAMRTLFGWRPLVALGQRSYGLYLWHWPVFALAEVRTHPGRLVWAVPLSVVLSEVSYRAVETPIRRGVVGWWWSTVRSPTRRRAWLGASSGAVVLFGVGVGMNLAEARPVDIARGDQTAVFAPAIASAEGTPAPVTPVPVPPVQITDAADPVPTTTSPDVTVPDVTVPDVTAPDVTVPDATVPVTSAPALVVPVEPRRVVVVGDSQAHSLAVNLPSGIESFFRISDGAVDGCGVHHQGIVRSERRGFSRSFENCREWSDRWATAATRAEAEIALVVIGAWDVFDLEVDGSLVRFGTMAGDQAFVDGVRRGVEALTATGAHVALLEVPCMRPQDVAGAGVPALPERGDDSRVARLNRLLRYVAATDPDTVTFVPGPVQWCSDETVASDLAYRWDGVHVYQRGAALIFESIAPALLAIG